MPVCNLKLACSTLCANRDCSLVAVAGRKVFKIIRIAPELSVHLDLRDLPPKQLNLNYGCQDVQWNPKEDHLIASAPNTGSIVLWDLNSKALKNKLDHVFRDIHTRAVNKICFHPREVNLLISGSQDATMQTIDIRTKSPTQIFKGMDSVRDVKICPHAYPRDLQFAASFDNGAVQIWDRRQHDSPVKSFQVHSGPAYSCSWHPEVENWLASAGRDKTIKILELQQQNVSRPKEVHSVYTMSSVARVKWRPNHKHHIASCSHLLDTVVAVWDVRRSYIPLASFTSHTDDVTDFAWLNDSHIVSCAKDGKFIYEGIQKTVKPADKATPVGLSISTDGNFAHACGDYVSHRPHGTSSSSQVPPYSTGSWRPFTFRKPSESTDPLTASQPAFLDVNSALKEYIHCGEQSKIDSFVTMATSYKLQGASLHELCDHNYKIAQGLGKRGIAQTWRMLSLLYCDKQTDLQQLGFLPPLQSGLLSQLSYRVCSANSIASDLPQSSKDGAAADTARPIIVKEAVMSAGGSVADDEGSESSSSGDNADEMLDFHDDFDEFMDRDSDVAAASSTSHNITDWELPAEPFLPRQKLRPVSPVSAESASQSAQGSTEPGRTSRIMDTYNRHHQQQAIQFPHWNFRQTVANVLSFYAEKGDVQTNVSIILVLQDPHLQKLMDVQLVELWFSSYIDLLKRKQLWKEAALIVKLCPLEEISSESQNSTTMINSCGYCKKSLHNSGWACERCEKLTNHCSVCHGTVRGLYTSCQTCGHGGHLEHMIKWHQSNIMCPSGCGHNCIT